MFQKVSDGLPTRSTFVRAKCSVTGDVFAAYFDSENQVFLNNNGEVIVFGDPEVRPDDQWEIVTDVFNQERSEHDRSVYCGSNQSIPLILYCETFSFKLKEEYDTVISGIPEAQQDISPAIKFAIKDALWRGYCEGVEKAFHYQSLNMNNKTNFRD